MNKPRVVIIPTSSGSSAPMTVNVTWDAEREMYISDKTFGEIADAYRAGREVMLVEEVLNEYDTSFTYERRDAIAKMIEIRGQKQSEEDPEEWYGNVKFEIGMFGTNSCETREALNDEYIFMS